MGVGLPGRRFQDGVSHSGHERNHLFLSLGGRQYRDVSGVSGADHPGDGRAFALLDFDRDGRLDIAAVNANEPLLQLYRNELPGEAAGRAIALRLVGANRRAQPAADASNRDGFGAQVEVEVGDAVLLREHRAGEGFAAQNSATLLVGIGERASAQRVRVRWSSGARSELADVPAGTLTTIYEDPSQAPGMSGFTRTAYRAPRPADFPAPEPAPPDPALAALLPEPAAPLHVLTTLATWCEACLSDLPQLEILRESFSSQELALWGVPVDAEDSRQKLERWMRRHGPRYQLLRDLEAAQVRAVEAAIQRSLRRDGIPASLVLDRDGRLLHAGWGVPTVSKLRLLVADR